MCLLICPKNGERHLLSAAVRDWCFKAVESRDYLGLDTRKRSWGVANSKEADQPAHLRFLIGTFVICLLESIIPKLATSKIASF